MLLGNPPTYRLPIIIYLFLSIDQQINWNFPYRSKISNKLLSYYILVDQVTIKLLTYQMEFGSRIYLLTLTSADSRIVLVLST